MTVDLVEHLSSAVHIHIQILIFLLPHGRDLHSLNLQRHIRGASEPDCTLKLGVVRIHTDQGHVCHVGDTGRSVGVGTGHEDKCSIACRLARSVFEGLIRGNHRSSVICVHAVYTVKVNQLIESRG